MTSSQTGGDATVTWNISSGYFGTDGARSQTYTNANLVFTSVKMNDGLGEAVTTFSSATTVTGAGEFSMSSKGLFQDFVFAGNMTGYTGNIVMVDFAGSGGTPTSTTLGYDGSNVVQFGGTTAGGTKALGPVTGSGPNRVINNVAGTGSITANVLVFNYGTDASYDSVKITNAITQRRGIHFLGNANIEASGVIAGTGTLNSLTKSGSGILTLSNANTYTGSTTISAGTLQIGNGGSTGSLAIGSAITNNGTLAFNRTDAVTQGTDFSSSAITGSGTLQQKGGGTLTLNKTNTYSGLTTVSNGTLAYGINNAIGTGGITVNGATATLALGAYTDSVGTVTVASGGQITGTGTGTLTSTVGFEMKDGSVSANLAGGVALNKTTAGTITLSAANTYTGTTTISAGKLTIAAAGTINSSSAITIQGGELNYNSTTALSKAPTFSGTGGTLSGTGAITPAIIVTSGNTYTAGALGGVGTQTLTGGVKFESNSIFSWDITGAASDTGSGALNAGSYDQVIGTASGSAAILNIFSNNGFSSAFWDTNKSWNNLFTTGSLSGIFSSITGSGIVWSGGQGSVANQGYFTTNGSNLNWTAVPEPTSALAALLLGAGLLRRRRVA